METWSAHGSDKEPFGSLKIEVMAPRCRIEVLRCSKEEKQVEECKRKKNGRTEASRCFNCHAALEAPRCHAGNEVAPWCQSSGTAVPLLCSLLTLNERCGACFTALRRSRPATSAFLCPFLTSFDALATIGLYRTNLKRDFKDFSASKTSKESRKEEGEDFLGRNSSVK
ncbi:hypothetical protein TorRG33x02_149230 [Trema orientale]|uniref:Uncharacterized protein n=1 Tax=Trema orientale TaxID=63057 RepID=A0A2P5EUN3_TREOI|nr:hypothetical protein TorRG33x02_149230 [Trema orientale]